MKKIVTLGNEFNLVEMFGTAPKQHLTESSLFDQPQICNKPCLYLWL